MDALTSCFLHTKYDQGADGVGDQVYPFERSADHYTCQVIFPESEQMNNIEILQCFYQEGEQQRSDGCGQYREAKETSYKTVDKNYYKYIANIGSYDLVV